MFRQTFDIVRAINSRFRRRAIKPRAASQAELPLFKYVQETRLTAMVGAQKLVHCIAGYLDAIAVFEMGRKGWFVKFK